MENIHPLIAQNKKIYNTIASHFAQTREYPWDELEPFADLVQPGQTVADIGCGNGRVFRLFSDKDIRYIGVDQSEGLIAIAQHDFPAGTWMVGEMSHIPLEDESCDLVMCVAALQHMPTPELRLQAMKELARITKPGSYICLTNWNLYSTTASKRHPAFAPGDFMIPWKDSVTGESLGDRYYHGFTMEELSGLATGAGLTVIEQYFIAAHGERPGIDKGRNIVTVLRK